MKLMTSDLVRILKDASLFASSDNLLPIINAVHLTVRDGGLLAFATDRFILGASKAPVEEPGDLEVALTLRQVKTVLQLANSFKQAFSTVALKVEAKKFHVAFTSGESLALPVELDDGPQLSWLTLLSTPAKDDSPAKAMDVNPQLLARFARVTGGPRRMRLWFSGANKAMRVSIGDEFVGLIMPVRMPDETAGDWCAPDWLNAPPKPKRKPRAKKVPA
ncbi:hypothetical protein BA059_16700 [Mycolicibacterium sp. (ex Dasyatis americana)]|nr:hypothetical protein BA059_16700 [Mycolicibacterium sp. (ex Dasyatis americana)]